MQRILIPRQRAALLDKKKVSELEAALKCRIEVEDGNDVLIDGDGYWEYVARNVLMAYGRGFSIAEAMRLLAESYFFKYLNLKDALSNDKQIRRIKARIIGSNGKTKKRIEEFSGAALSVYGNGVGVIGTEDEIEVAMAALRILVGGGMHSNAYRAMELEKKKKTSSRFGV